MYHRERAHPHLENEEGIIGRTSVGGLDREVGRGGVAASSFSKSSPTACLPAYRRWQQSPARGSQLEGR